MRMQAGMDIKHRLLGAMTCHELCELALKVADGSLVLAVSESEFIDAISEGLSGINRDAFVDQLAHGCKAETLLDFIHYKLDGN